MFFLKMEPKCRAGFDVILSFNQMLSSVLIRYLRRQITEKKWSVDRDIIFSDTGSLQGHAARLWQVKFGRIFVLLVGAKDINRFCFVDLWLEKKFIFSCNFLETRLSHDMRFPTMWYVRPAKAQTSLRIRADWSELLLVAWIFYEC